MPFCGRTGCSRRESRSRAMILFLFGVPGAGKSFVGRILRDEFGFYFHDADHDLPDSMRGALATKQPVTDAMRDHFFERVVASMRRLAAQHERLAVAQTLMKDKHRRVIQAAFPQAHFIRVESPPDLIESRFLQRTSYLIDLEDARRISAQFEPPTLHHRVLQNVDGRGDVIGQLGALLKEFPAEIS